MPNLRLRLTQGLSLALRRCLAGATVDVGAIDDMVQRFSFAAFLMGACMPNPFHPFRVNPPYPAAHQGNSKLS
jgi:hypothetical protein